MNRKMVFYMIGKIVQAEAAMLLLPLVVALLYKETPLPFLITIGIALVLGIALSLIFKPKDRVIYAKEGFVIVAFAWIALSLIGCIPLCSAARCPTSLTLFLRQSAASPPPAPAFSQMWNLSPDVFCSGEVLPTGLEEWEFLSFFFPSFPWPVALT